MCYNDIGRHTLLAFLLLGLCLAHFVSAAESTAHVIRYFESVKRDVINSENSVNNEVILTLHPIQDANTKVVITAAALCKKELVLVGGQSYSTILLQDYNGNLLWSFEFNRSANSTDILQDIAAIGFISKDVDSKYSVWTVLLPAILFANLAGTSAALMGSVYLPRLGFTPRGIVNGSPATLLMSLAYSKGRGKRTLSALQSAGALGTVGAKTIAAASAIGFVVGGLLGLVD